MTLAPGTLLGPYEIVAPLGAGGMGEVFRARDPRLGREVAIKVLPAELARDTERLRRFEVEARAASSLNHANLLTVFELGEVEGQPYLVTELLDGRSLRDALADDARLSPRQVDWGAQIARGLAAAHEKGIVHRDLKPENLFVCADGRVKILDFGLAKLTHGDGGALATAATIAGGQTASGIVLGTVGYMAPEQVRGERVDARADLFALGTVLYELLTGRRAFRGESAIESLNAILKEEPTPLAEQRPELPPTLVLAIERCLDKSPSRRFQSAADLAWALESGASSGAIAPRGVATSGLPVRRAGRWLAAAALVAVAAFGALLLGRAVGGRNADSAPTWSGERLIGGAVLAYGPQPSPDGSLVAFLVLDESHQSQVAVLRPGESRFTLLTSDATSGPVLSLAWSKDGRSIYFRRAIANTIRSVPALGGEDRLVLEQAGKPVALPDGTLLAARSVGPGVYRLLRYFPDRAETAFVGPEVVDLSAPGPEGTLAAFPDGKEALVFGQRKEDVGRRGPGLWAIDLGDGSARALAPELDFRRAAEGIALPAVAVDPLRDEALVVVPRGDLHVVVAVPRSGRGPTRTLLHLTAPPFTLGVGRDGAIYVDQIEVSGSVLRIGAESGDLRRIARFAGSPGRSTGPLELPDGGVLFNGIESGATRLLVARPGRRPAPFVEVGEETSGPACLLDAGHVAFLVGSTDTRQVAIATLDGRIVRRLPTPGPGAPSAFSPLGDGRSLLYGVGDRLLAIDTSNGSQRELTRAETGTIDPRNGDLVVLRPDGSGHRFGRLEKDGSPLASYGLGPDLYVEPWSSSALDQRGRLLVSLGEPDTWWVAPAVVELGADRVRKIPLDFEGDIFTPSWGRDGSILAIGWEYAMNVWRFTRTDETAR